MYRSKDHGLLFLANNMFLLDSGYYTFKQYKNHKNLKVSLYEEIDREEALSHEMFLKWCEQEDKSPYHYNELKNYIIEVNNSYE